MCIYVRELSSTEGNKLKRIIRRDKNSIAVRRAQVILASAQGMSVPEIARLYYFSEKYIRTLIKNFDKEGFDSLKTKDGRVICVDEFGPLEVKPESGQNWRPSGKTDRIPATYHRTEGTQFLFSAYELSTDKLYEHMILILEIYINLYTLTARTRL